VTQRAQACYKLVPIANYYRVKMNLHQTIKTSRPKADKPLSSRHRVKLWNCRLIMLNHGNSVWSSLWTEDKEKTMHARD